MAQKRICMMCGEEYEFCSHCNDFDPFESWKYLYHDEKCREIGHIWYAYRGDEISKEEAKKGMSEIKPNIDNVLQHTSIAANEIREIFDIKDFQPKKTEVAQNIKKEKKTPVDVEGEGTTTEKKTSVERRVRNNKK